MQMSKSHLKTVLVDRKAMKKASALNKDRMEWLREENRRVQKENMDLRKTNGQLRADLKEATMAKSIISSKHYATRANMRKIKGLLDKDYQLNA